MAVSTPPPPHPPQPDPTATTTAATTTTRSNFPPNRGAPNRLTQTSPFFSTTPTTEYHHTPLLPPNPNPNYPRMVPTHDPTAPTTASATSAAAILYPVASSGRGFIASQMSLSSNPNSNSSNMYSTRPSVLSSTYHRPPFGHSHRDPALGQASIYGNGVGNPTQLQQPGVLGNSAVRGAAMNATLSQPQHKVAHSSTPFSSFNDHKDLRERSKDDVFVTVHDRKVRVSDNASLYALCRSWLKNGSPEECQLRKLDVVRPLPSPLPLSAEESTSPTIVEEFKEVEEDEGSVEHLSPKELLQRHVNRAKSVRSRIREQRSRRIAPYKNRLFLVLHPVGDSNFRNDSVTGE